MVEEKEKEKYEFRVVNKSDIDIPEWLPRKPLGENRDENSFGLSDSIDNLGLINPITLIQKENGRYDLITGTRRFDAISGETIDTKIVFNKSKFELMEMSLAENAQRKDIDLIDYENFTYATHLQGLEEKKITCIADSAKRAGVSIEKMKKIKLAGEERFKEKNKDNILIQRSPSNILHATRSLVKNPLVRNKILEMEQKKTILIKNIPEVTKQIKTCIDKGVSDKNAIKIIELVVPQDTNKSNVNNGNNSINNNNNFNSDNSMAHGVITITDNSNDQNINTTKIGKIQMLDPRKLEEFTNVVIESHPDIQEKLINKKISLEEAKEINQFESKAARDQLFHEKREINKWKVDSVNQLDKEWKNNIGTRKIQEQEVKANGVTELRTNFDIEHQKKLDLVASRDSRRDEEYVRKYQSLKANILSTISIYGPTKVKNENSKLIIKNIIKEVHKLCRLVLIDLGEIKSNDTDFINAEYSIKE